MEYAQFGDHFVVRVDEGEEAVSTLRDFLAEHNILGGYFVAWGAFKRLKLAFQRPTEHGYEPDTRTFEQQLEVASLLGNIACSDGKPMVHAHLTVGDEEYRSYSGHLLEGTVRPMLEVFVTPFPRELRRTWNEQRQLAMLDLTAVGAPACAEPVP